MYPVVGEPHLENGESLMKTTLRMKLIQSIFISLLCLMGQITDSMAGEKVTVIIVEATGNHRCSRATNKKGCQDIRRNSIDKNLQEARRQAENLRKNEDEPLEVFLLGINEISLKNAFEETRNSILAGLEKCSSTPNVNHVFAKFKDNQTYTELVPASANSNLWTSSTGCIRVSPDEGINVIHPLFHDFLPGLIKCTTRKVGIESTLPTSNKVDLTNIDEISVYLIADEHDGPIEKDILKNYTPATSSLGQFYHTELKRLSTNKKEEIRYGIKAIDTKLWHTSYKRILQFPERVNLQKDRSTFSGTMLFRPDGIHSTLSGVLLGNSDNSNSPPFLTCSVNSDNRVICSTIPDAIISNGHYDVGIMDGKRLLAKVAMDVSGMQGKILDLHKDQNLIDFDKFPNIKTGAQLYLCNDIETISSCRVNGLKQCVIPWDVIRTLQPGPELYSIRDKTCDERSESLLDITIKDNGESRILIHSYYDNSNLADIKSYPLVQTSRAVYGCGTKGAKITLLSGAKHDLDVSFEDKLLHGYDDLYEIKTNSCRNSISLGTVQISTPWFNREFNTLIGSLLAFLSVLYCFTALLSKRQLSNQDVTVNSLEKQTKHQLKK
jgi:hypothetical protein